MSGLDQNRERLHRLTGEIVSTLVDDPAAASEILAAVTHGLSRARERAESLFDNYGYMILLSINPPIAMSIMASEVSILTS